MLISYDCITVISACTLDNLGQDVTNVCYLEALMVGVKAYDSAICENLAHKDSLPPG